MEEYKMKYVPVLDKGFRPMYAEFKKYSEEAAKTENKLLKICVERNDGYNLRRNKPWR